MYIPSSFLMMTNILLFMTRVLLSIVVNIIKKSSSCSRIPSSSIVILKLTTVALSMVELRIMLAGTLVES